MADASNLKVAVERAIHDGLREIIQRISDQHHIQLAVIRIDWIDVSDCSVTEHAYVVSRLETTEFSK